MPMLKGDGLRIDIDGDPYESEFENCCCSNIYMGANIKEKMIEKMDKSNTFAKIIVMIIS